MSKPLQYVCYIILFVVCFLFFVYLTFPFNILKESLVMKLNKATGLNIAIYDLSPSLLLGIEAQGVSLKTPTGQEVKFSAVEVSLSTLHLFIGRLRCVLEVQDAQENPLEVAAGFGLFSLIANATSGKPPLPDKITVKASNYGLNDLTAYALSSYAGKASTNPLIVPLLEQMEVRGSLNTDIKLALDLEDPTASDGSLDLSIDKFVLAMNAPDFTIDDQIFEKALVKAKLKRWQFKNSRRLGILFARYQCANQWKFRFKDTFAEFGNEPLYSIADQRCAERSVWFFDRCHAKRHKRWQHSAAS